jgi:hypothetical protein
VACWRAAGPDRQSSSAGPGDLKGLRAPVRPDGYRLAVENRGAGGEGRDEVDDFGESIGDLVQGAGEKPHLRADFVRLDANAVDFALKVNGHAVGHCRGHLGRTSCQHWPQRPPDLHGHRGKGVLAAGQRRHRHRPRESGEHGRPLHGRQRHVGGLGDRGQHDAVLRALAHPAEQQPAQVVLLRRRRSPQKRIEPVPAGGRRAGPGRGPDRLECGVDVGDAQARLVGGVGRSARVRHPTPIRRWGSTFERYAATVATS